MLSTAIGAWQLSLLLAHRLYDIWNELEAMARGKFPRPGGWELVTKLLEAAEGLGFVLLILAGLLLLRRSRLGVRLLVTSGAILASHFIAIVCIAGRYWPEDYRMFRYFLQTVHAGAMALYPAVAGAWLLGRERRDHVRSWRSAERHAAGADWPTVMAWLSIVLGTTQFVQEAILLSSAGIGVIVGPESWAWAPSEWCRFAVRLAESLLGGPLLVVAGLLLLRRRKAGAVLHVAYALLIVPLLVAQVCIRPPMDGEPIRGPAYDYLSIAAEAIATLVTLAYPAVILAWFLRPGIRSQIRSWSAAGGASRDGSG